MLVYSVRGSIVPVTERRRGAQVMPLGYGHEQVRYHAKSLCSKGEHQDRFFLIPHRYRQRRTETLESNAGPRHAARRVLDMRRKDVVCAQHALHERRRNDVSTLRARVRVVVRVERVHGSSTKRLEPIRDVLPVVDVARPDRVRGGLRVPDEPRRRVLEGARLPGVVGRLAAHDDVRALGLQRLARLDLVEDEGVDGLARRGRDACLLPVPEAVRAPVVRGAQRPAVVVPELDHDEVAGLDDVDDRLEPTLVREGARGAAPDRVVDDFDVERVPEVLTPTWRA